MAQFISFGNGHDGNKVVSGTEDVNTRTSCSGSAGATTLSVTSESGFVAGDMVMIHKSRGDTTTTCGTYEINFVVSTSSGQLTLLYPLVNSYQDLGTNQSQCILVPQYSSLTVPVSTTITPSSWDLNVGGITVIACNGLANIVGTISVNGSNGANGVNGVNGPTTTGGSYYGGPNEQGGQQGYQGEGTGGVGTSSTAANGNGGGGGYENGSESWGSGGGGGHANSGGNGTANSLGSGGTGGAVAGTSDLTTMVFGGGGGGGAVRTSEQGGAGGSGGGIIVLLCRYIQLTGAVRANGGNGGNPSYLSGGGGGGAGGSILIRSVSVILGSGLITATGGSGGTSAGSGSVGRIRIEACSRTGTTNPLASESVGGFSYCGSAVQVIE